MGAALYVAFVSAVQAQALNWGEEYAKRIKATEAVSPLGDDVFGDQITLFNGTVSFPATDLLLPGNNVLPVQLTRASIGRRSVAAAASARKGRQNSTLMRNVIAGWRFAKAA